MFSGFGGSKLWRITRGGAAVVRPHRCSARCTGPSRMPHVGDAASIGQVWRHGSAGSLPRSGWAVRTGTRWGSRQQAGALFGGFLASGDLRQQGELRHAWSGGTGAQHKQPNQKEKHETIHEQEGGGPRPRRGACPRCWRRGLRLLQHDGYGHRLGVDGQCHGTDHHADQCGDRSCAERARRDHRPIDPQLVCHRGR